MNYTSINLSFKKKGNIQPSTLFYFAFIYLPLLKSGLKVLVTQSSNSAIPWTVAHQLLYPWGFPGKVLECVAFSSPGDLPNPGMAPVSPALQTDSLLSEPQCSPYFYCLLFLFFEIHPMNSNLDRKFCISEEINQQCYKQKKEILVKYLHTFLQGKSIIFSL